MVRLESYRMPHLRNPGLQEEDRRGISVQGCSLTYQRPFAFFAVFPFYGFNPYAFRL